MNIDDGDGRYTIQIAPFAAEPERFLVEIFRPHWEYRESHVPAKVTCCSFGGSPDEAEEYAASLMKAAEIARQLDAEYDKGLGLKSE